MIDPTHNSLLADYYPMASRSRVYSTHRAANAVGAFVGPLVAGLLAFQFGWRVPFLVFVAPTLVVRRSSPSGSANRCAAAGSGRRWAPTADVVLTEETPPSFAESWRTVQRIPTLRRLWASLPFLAVSLVGFVALAALLYEQEFGLDERARGIARGDRRTVPAGRPRRRRQDRDEAIRRRLRRPDPVPLDWVALAAAGCSALFALSPNLVVAVALNCAISALLAVVAPGILTALVVRHPAAGAGDGFLGRVAVGHPRPADPAAHRVDRRRVDDPRSGCW